jgi:small-conductance mechanosensitive channel
MNRQRRYIAQLLTGMVLLLIAGQVLAQLGESTRQIPTAPVWVDGKVLFELRGISAYPAEERAARVRERIIDLARNESIGTDEILFRQENGNYVIEARDQRLIMLIEADANIEGIPLEMLAEVVALRIEDGVTRYREDRSADALMVSSAYFVGLTVALLALIWLLRRLRRWANRVLETRIAASIDQLEQKSHRIVQGAHVWKLAESLLNLLFVLLGLILAYFYISSVLGTFPWTRSFAMRLLDVVVQPLVVMGEGFVRSIPKLAFLTVLFFLVRYLLRALKLFFTAVEYRRITISGFDPEWGMPTYRLVRVAVIAFAVVIAYPYIPGSESAAFKGVSLFLGVVVSLGSTSFIANMIAGLTMTYRGAYRVGDWVRIGEEEGRVTEMRMMVMRLRTRKNESVTMPNSLILNSSVHNFSALAREEGLVLHTEVSIGYDASWRKVEAMLLEAARRTEGVVDEPPPFVNQKSLGDFAVTYELNATVRSPERIPLHYSDLHRNIQDVFNEHGVQIMSPAYVSDPEHPKLVPPSEWDGEAAPP